MKAEQPIAGSLRPWKSLEKILYLCDPQPLWNLRRLLKDFADLESNLQRDDEREDPNSPEQVP